MFRFFLLLFLTVGILCSSMAQVNEQDSLALVALYESTDGDNWTNNDNWLVGPVESWYGVEIEDGRVSNLNLHYNGGNYGNNLNGFLPTEIGQLGELQYLNLRKNHIFGSIPEEIGHLEQLEFLDLGDNDFTGSLPEGIGALGSLQRLILELNEFSGNVPDTIQALEPRLRELRLSFNSFSGEVLIKLSNLSRLENLYLSGNQFVGNIPTELVKLTRLEFFSLAGNQFSGDIPKELGGLEGLRALSLNGNNLVSEIPAELGLLSNLYSLRLDDNLLSGEIPEELGNLSQLEQLEINNNNVSGSIPMSFTNLNNLGLSSINRSKFDYSNTNLCEPDNQEYQDWSSGRNIINNDAFCHPSLTTDSLALVALYESTDGDNWTNNTNWLEGPVESWYGVEVVNQRVEKIQLERNGLDGSLPIEIGDLSELKFLSFSHNSLSGSLIEEILNLENLEYLILTANQFTGNIPSAIGRLDKLIVIRIDVNEITGNIPTSIVNLTELISISLNNNSITGGIPEDIGRLTKLSTLFLSANSLSGPLPPSIGDLRALTYLNLAGNELSGSIPDQMGQLDRLKHLYLNSNLFSGSIPLSFTNMASLALLEDQSVFSYSSTALCEPDNQEFRDWKEGRNIGGTDQICGMEDTGTMEFDSLALVALYKSTDGDNWYEAENWLTGDIESWYGIEITNLRVTKIDLGGNNIIGPLPDQLTDISKLNYLDLSDNPLVSPVLSFITDLPNIEFVNFRYCNLEEEFPQDLQELRKLDAIELDYNFIYGFLPESLSSSSSLTYLSISSNELTGQVPESYTNLTQLEYFDYAGNYLCDPSSTLFEDWRDSREVIGDQIKCADLAQIESFNFDQQIGNTEYDLENFSIQITVDRRADITQLVPHFTISDGARIEWCVNGDDTPVPISGESILDFTNPLCITVTSEFDIESIEWEVLVELQVGLESDSLALVTFYESTAGDSWTNNENWLTGPLSTWFGVWLKDERVSSIFLFDNNLVGQIPAEIGQLDSLNNLTLGINKIAGTIPDEIGDLRVLEDLNLSSNKIEGSIPRDIGGLYKLRRLDLSANQLQASLPEGIANLSSLVHLQLDFNRFEEPLPESIGNLENLETLNLRYNKFLGNIPSSWSNLINIKNIDLSGNGLYGSLPEGFGELLQLEAIELGDNNFTGEIPLSWYGLGELRVLELMNNDITGEISPNLGNLEKLSSLYLTGNDLEGTIPPEIGQLAELKVLNIDKNRFNGSLPFSIGNLVELIALNINDNFLEGPLPLSIVNLDNLALNETYVLDFGNTEICEPTEVIYSNWKTNRFITSTGISCPLLDPSTLDSLALVALYESTDGDNWTNNTNWLTGDVDTWNGVGLNGLRVSSLELFNNNLTGELPDDIGQLTEVVHLNLISNNISGIIPRTVGGMTQLEYLYLEENRLTGSIPEEIGNLVKLKYLHLHTNQLSNDIPNTIGQLILLEDLHLASNHLTGAIPLSIGALASIKSIDLGDNDLTGEIPAEIGQLAALESLVLNRNNLSGSIPASFGLLINLDYFSLTKNNLTGELPTEVGNMENLRVFDIEDNQLSGELPESLANLSRLERVYLFGNQLEGTIPKDFLELNSLSELVIFDNLFDSLPNVSQSKPDLQIVAHTNRLTFADIEPNITLFESDFQYSPQRQFGFVQSVSSSAAQDVFLSQGKVGGTMSSYQWYKDNEIIEGATSDIYALGNPSPESEGTYTLKVTNSLVPALTLTSHPIELIYEPRTENEILSYSIPGEFAPANVNETNKSITVYLPCDAPDIAIPSFELSGGAAAFVGDEAQLSGVSSVDFSGMVDYTVIAEDGSESLWTINVANPNPVEIFSTINHLSSCNTSGGLITIDSVRLESSEIIRLPDSRFSLLWSNSSTDHQIDVTAEGTYTVEITGTEMGCGYSRSFDVLTKDLEGVLSLREKRDNTSCGVANGLISVDANIGSSQGLDYAWYKGTIATGAIIQRTKAIDNLEAGSYTLVVTDLDTDCTTSLTAAIEDAQQALDINLKSTANKSCTSPSGTVALATITVDGEERTSTLGYWIEWSQTEGIEKILAQTREVNGLASGTYYARLIGVETGCTSQVRSVTIVDDQQSLIFDVSTIPNSRCDEIGTGSATLTALPTDHQIQWYSGEALVQGETLTTISSLTSGSYQAVVTDNTTGCEATSAFEIENETTEISLEVTSSENISCGEPIGEARVVAVIVGEQRTTNLEAFSFEWWLPSEETRLIQGRVSLLTDILGGDYFVQATLDSVGCQSAPLKVTVQEDIQHFAVALAQSRPDLPGSEGTGRLQIEVLDQPEDYTISWYEGDSPLGFIIGETHTLDNVNEGPYTVQVTDSSTGCEVIATYEVGIDERSAQVINFDLPEIINNAELPLTLTATSDEGLPVSFTIVEGEGEIQQSALISAADGFITIKAYNEGTTTIAYAESIRTIRLVSDFYLRGTVTGAADGSQVSGEVVVFTLDGEVFAQNTFTDGSYFIDGLPEGKYRLLIEVTGSSNAVAYDTYYNRQLLWNRATILTINDNTEVNVELIPKTTTIMTGQGSITGRIVRTDGGSRIVIGRTLDGTPLADVDIYLYTRSANEVVAQAVTDEDGVFLFDNVPSGQYYFRIDAVGFDIADLGADVDYDEEEGTLEISAAIGTEGLTVEYAVVSGVEEALLQDISIFPNPAQNILHVEDTQNRIKTIQLLNLAGQLARTFEANLSDQYDISGLTNGMYMIRIELEDQQFVHTKVVIRH